MLYGRGLRRERGGSRTLTSCFAIILSQASGGRTGYAAG